MFKELIEIYRSVNWEDKRITIGHLLGITLDQIKGMEIGSEEVLFLSGSTKVHMLGEDDQAEITLVDIIGNVECLIGHPIIKAEQVAGWLDEESEQRKLDSCTWTFYDLATIKGTVTLRWLGISNGYYSEEVSMIEYSYRDLITDLAN